MPDGGRVYVARMVRDDTSSDWEIDHGSPLFKTFDLPIASTDPITGCHAHSCYLVEYGEVGDENKPVQLVVSLGDGQFNNRIARFIWENDEGDHGDFTENWVEADDFHGRRTTGTDPVDPGSLNFQPVGVAGMLDIQQVGEDYFYSPSLIWGTDVTSEWINQFVLPLPGATPDQATVRHLWGWDTGYGSARSGYLKYPYSLMATINESAPEILGPLVATVYDTTDQNGPIPARVLYNAGIADRPLTAWHQVASVFGANVTSAVRFNDSIWFSQWGETGAGLYKVGVPTDETDFEPIIVSPGGTNLVHEEYALTQVMGTQLTDLTSVPRENSGVPGLFEDPDSLVVLPPCPTMAKQAWRIETDRGVPGSTAKHYITDVHVSSDSDTSWNDLDPEWEVGPRIRRYRAWVLDNSYDNVANFAPNKSLQMSTTILNLDTVDPDSFPNKPGPTKYSSADRWCPVTFIAYHNFLDDLGLARALGLELRSVWSGEADWPDDNNWVMTS